MNTPQRTRTQLHVSIDTRDLAGSRSFYRALFGEEPVLAKQDYLRFWPEELGLVLGLNGRTKERGSTGPMRHLGLLFPSASALADARARLESAGFGTHGKANTTCCYARLDQFWATDPSGVEWELFLSHEDEIQEAKVEEAGTCCAPDCCA